MGASFRSSHDESVSDVLAIVERFFPDDPLGPKALAVIQDVFG